MLAVGGMWALIRTIHRLCPISHGSRHTERHITTTKVHRSGDERRSCRAKTREEDGTEEELAKRNERDAAIARYNNPSSQFLFSFSLVVIYVKIFHGTAALSACTVPKTFAHDAGLLSPSRFDLFLSLSLSRPAFPTRRKVPRAPLRAKAVLE